MDLFSRITTKWAYKFHCNVECLKIFVVKISRIEQNSLKPQNFYPSKLNRYTVASYRLQNPAAGDYIIYNPQAPSNTLTMLRHHSPWC